MKKNGKSIFRITLAVVFFVTFSLVVFSNTDYPERPVTMVVPWSAGGSTDICARAFQFPFQGALGVPVVVNNMPGGSALVGSEFVLNADPDGYTLLFSSDSPGHWRALGLSPTTSWQDFNPLMILTIYYSTVCVNADSKWNTIDELIEDIRNRPGEISVGIAGMGASAHTMSLLLEKFADIKLKIIPYQGGGPANVGLLNKEVDLSFGLIAEVLDYVENGDFKLLATFTEERVPDFPDIPTVSEKLPELKPWIKGSTFASICSPKGTPDEINEILVNAAKEAIKDPKWLEAAKNMNFVTPYYTGEEAVKFVEDWGNLKSWIFYEAGIAEHSPEEFGIPKPY